MIVIGAMKAGTTALHRYLDAHPEIGMAPGKELNFFFGADRQNGGRGDGLTGNWHRGLDWYRGQLPPARVSGETSPGYTSPSFPETAERIARVVPEVRLIYLVRDPVERALSQYRHHRAEGAERRSVEEALLEPGSQYVARSRFHARLRPFLVRFPLEQLFVCSHEELLHDRRRTLRTLYRFLGVDEQCWSREHERRWHVGRGEPVSLEPRVLRTLCARLTDDADRLRDLLGRKLSGWSV